MHTIFDLDQGHFQQWEPLWLGYLDFYRAALPPETTRRTFECLVGEDDAMFGLLAMDGTGQGLGLVHCVVHPTTWSDAPTCYLEDLFVAPGSRGSELGRALLEEAKQASLRHGAERLYWHTQSYNGRARSLYDQVARPTSFVVYEM